MSKRPDVPALTDSLPAGLAGRLNPICDRFEALWQSGGQPVLEEFLPLVAEADRPALLRELLALEREYRGRRGETPTADEYRRRFPEYAALVDQAFAAPGAGPDAAPVPLALPGYEILGELGRGGMGVVYQARQLGFNRIVALKMILSGAHAGADERDRFRTETEAVARLQHPNIVQVYEVGEHDGKPFFSMEFCSGGGLDRKLNGTPLPPAEAAQLIETLARAVHAAHQQNVVHRDLKPANVLLSADGSPKVTDFGLAKKLDEGGQTRTGAVMGTPSYMAPEQAGGKSKEIGPATDVYALGAILYEMLTGRPPFKAATPLDTLMQVLQDEPVPPHRLQSRTPRDLETICLKCLEKQPARRYATAAELADDLGRWQRGEPVRARPVGLMGRAWRWACRHRAAAALIMTTAVVMSIATGVSSYFAIQAHSALVAEHNAQVAQQKAEERLLLLASHVAADQKYHYETRSHLDHGRVVTEMVTVSDGSHGTDAEQIRPGAAILGGENAGARSPEATMETVKQRYTLTARRFTAYLKQHPDYLSLSDDELVRRFVKDNPEFTAEDARMGAEMAAVGAPNVIGD